MERADRRLLGLLALELTIAELIAAAAATAAKRVPPCAAKPSARRHNATWFRADLIRA